MLEVKGGIIAYAPENHQWTSTSKTGYVNRISDPFRQAMKSCHGLLGRIKKMISQHGMMRIYHASVFPHCQIRSEDLPGSTSSEITIDTHGLRDLENRILRAFEYWRNGAILRGPTFDEVLAALRRIHNGRVAGTRNISIQIAEHHAEFDRLTADQMRLLDMVAANRRLLVRGCAGSGKTFLAKRLAAKRSAKGEKVLVLCFNNLLGGLLEEELRNLPGVTATNFHHLCERLAREASVPLPSMANVGESAYYGALIDAAMKALESDSSLRFDTVIIDEAQDFDLVWWIVIESLLANSNASLTVFIDTNQILHGTSKGVPASLGPFAESDLSQNVRNTQSIHREALRFFRGDPEPSAEGPEGTAPTWIRAESYDEEIQRLAEMLGRLVKEDKISTEDIVVLTPKGTNSTSLRSRDKIGKLPLVPVEQREAGEIGWSTVRRFKGLESPIVIITELDGEIAKSAHLRELVYVGVTRARDYLYLIGASDTLTLLKQENR